MQSENILWNKNSIQAWLKKSYKCRNYDKKVIIMTKKSKLYNAGIIIMRQKV